MHFKILETQGNKAPDPETSRGKEVVKTEQKSLKWKAKEQWRQSMSDEFFENIKP